MVNRGGRKFVDKFQPTVDPDPIPSLRWDDHYKYLGFQMGRQRL